MIQSYWKAIEMVWGALLGYVPEDDLPTDPL